MTEAARKNTRPPLRIVRGRRTKLEREAELEAKADALYYQTLIDAKLPARLAANMVEWRASRQQEE